MVGTYDTAVLTRTVEEIDSVSTFILDYFFPFTQTELGSPEIHFDVDKSRPRLTPFVSPLVAGQIVDNEGFETKSFKPAYVKDKRVFDPDAPFKRKIGEPLTGNMSPAERLNALIASTQLTMLEMLTRRELVMAVEAIRTGKITVSGKGFSTKVVDFLRDAALTIGLTGALRWGEAGVSPYKNLTAWTGLVTAKGGGACRDIVFEPLGWELFTDDPKVDKLLDREAHRGNAPIVEGPVVRSGEGDDKFTFMGSIGHHRYWMGNDTYIDDNDVEQPLLPDHTVMGVSRGHPATGRGGMEGVRCYGSIKDEKANYEAERFFSKSWYEEDPAVRYLLLQSAPLPVMYRPNGSFCATVR